MPIDTPHTRAYYRDMGAWKPTTLSESFLYVAKAAVIIVLIRIVLVFFAPDIKIPFLDPLVFWLLNNIQRIAEQFGANFGLY